MQREPGSSMHIHQSVRDLATGRNLFAAEDGGNSEFFLHYIGGLQKYLSASMPLLAPYVNSYRRLMPDSDAPINVPWGVDNRPVGFRVPIPSPDARPVENRVAGADRKPYLAMARPLACGHLCILEDLGETQTIEGPRPQ